MAKGGFNRRLQWGCPHCRTNQQQATIQYVKEHLYSESCMAMCMLQIDPNSPFPELMPEVTEITTQLRNWQLSQGTSDVSGSCHCAHMHGYQRTQSASYTCMSGARARAPTPTPTAGKHLLQPGTTQTIIIRYGAKYMPHAYPISTCDECLSVVGIHGSKDACAPNTQRERYCNPPW